MISLTSITLREVALPMKEPFRTANGVVDTRRVLLLESLGANGQSVWSECVAEATAGYSDETVDTCWVTLSDEIGPSVIGREFESAIDANSFLASRFVDSRMARASVEMGFWALESIQKNIPLAVLLNKDAEPRAHVPAGIAIGKQTDPDSLAERCARAAQDGYRRVKIKISPGHDVFYARAARDAVGPTMSLSVDGNRSYSMQRETDRASLELLDEFDLSMIEQPLGDLDEHRDLQRLVSTPICLDESITGVTDVNEMMRLDSGRIVNIKPGRVGGLTEAIAIHDVCKISGVPVWCGGMNETGIGRAYNVALASLPNFTLPGDLSPSSRYWNEDIITNPWMMDKTGNLTVPLTQPGIGVEVNRALVERLTSRAVQLA